jgi:excisionase family DNA binding protein
LHADEHTWLTPEEVAERIKVTEQTVRRWLRSGELTGTLLGRVWRVSLADLKVFMDERKPKPGGSVPD